ncbi:MAG: PaaX family transcriptional regulator [Candidatus Dormibacteraceae bacterium]
MAACLRARSMLFTLFGDYVHPLGGREVWVGSLVRLAGEVGISPGALRSAVSRMGGEGWLTRRRVGSRPHYALSERGRRLIEEGARRIYRTERPDWDGQWLLVTYSAPHHRSVRDRLRTELAFLGFGSLSGGLYVTPHDLRPELAKLVREHGVIDYLAAMRGSLVLPPDPRAIVGRAWDLSALARRYRGYLARTGREFERDRRAIEGGMLGDAEAFRRRLLLTHRYRRFPFSDPDLPSCLLPARWPGVAAHRLFLEYNSTLRPGAERHFRSALDVANLRRPPNDVT